MALLATVQLSGLLLGTLVVGLAAHECSHLLALGLSGVPCTVEVLPGRGGGSAPSGLGSPLARVRPTGSLDAVPPTRLRVAALAPLCLAVPLLLILAGVVPDPFVSGTVGAKLVLIAWVGCSIPSPQDFSLAWYPEQAISTFAGRDTAPDTSAVPVHAVDDDTPE